MFEQESESVRNEASRRVESLENELGKRTESAEAELGAVVLNAVEQYFPEQTKQRRREDAAKAFSIGVVVGFLASYVLSQ